MEFGKNLSFKIIFNLKLKKMNTVLSTLFVSIIVFGCKDKPNPDVPTLLLGKWKLTEYKQENQQWRDSTGIFYNFLNANTVSTKILIYDCEREYQLNNSPEGLNQMDVLQNTSCFYQVERSVIIANISNTSMEIMYPDYVGGGGLIYKYEKYVKD